MNTLLIFLFALFTPDSVAVQTPDEELPDVEVVRTFQGNARDYVLQKPQISQSFGKRHILDHSFLEIGGGGTLPFAAGHELGGAAHLAFGNWVRPEHGWRISATFGKFIDMGVDQNVWGLNLDYLLNISAVANREYLSPKPLEVFAILGAGANMSTGYNLSRTMGFNVHTGLRAQWNFSKSFYAFGEAQVGGYLGRLYHKRAKSINMNRYAVQGTFEAGLGIHMPEFIDFCRQSQISEPFEHPNFLSHTFIQFLAGPSWLTNGKLAARHYHGPRFSLGFGKWFNPYFALRLSANAEGNQPDRLHIYGVQTEAMWNLFNTFGGYRKHRPFQVSLLAGPGAYYTTVKSFVPSIGGGLQFDIRPWERFSILVEPRVDAYYLNGTYVKNRLAVIPSVMVGLAFNQGVLKRQHSTEEQEEFDPTDGGRRKDDHRWFDNFFLDVSGGWAMDINRTSLKHVWKSLNSTVNLGVGKMFTTIHGARFWGESTEISDEHGGYVNYSSWGADYVVNLTNAFHNYRNDLIPHGRGEFMAMAGVGLAQRTDNHRLHLQVHFGLRGLLHLTPTASVFLEPHVRIAHYTLMHPESKAIFHMSILGAVNAGLQVNINSHYSQYNKEQYDEDKTTKRRWAGISGGYSVDGSQLHTSAGRGFDLRLTYGQWFRPASAWRVSAEFNHQGTSDNHFTRCGVSADYMLSLTTLCRGYEPERIVDLRYTLGVFLPYSNKGFKPDLHTGLQLNFRLNNRYDLYLEPQVGRKDANLLLGLNYKF